MRFYIVDDKQFSIDQLVKHIERTPGHVLVGTDTDPLRALTGIRSGEIKIDVLFLDIDMPDIDGLEFEKQVKGLAIVIFVSGYKKYAFDAFNSEAEGYLLKPVGYGKFLDVIEKVSAILTKKVVVDQEISDGLMVKLNSNKNLRRVQFDNIVYIEASDNYMLLHMNDDSTQAVNITMKKLMTLLPPKIFLRIHHSFAVNKNYISRIVGNTVRIGDKISLDVSRTYKKDLMASFRKI